MFLRFKVPVPSGEDKRELILKLYKGYFPIFLLYFDSFTFLFIYFIFMHCIIDPDPILDIFNFSILVIGFFLLIITRLSLSKPVEKMKVTLEKQSATLIKKVKKRQMYRYNSAIQ